MTFMTFYTPTYKRPLGLARCKASVAAQTDSDYQHLVIEDTVGIGIDGVFRDVPKYHDQLQGEYVYFLCDDDVLTDPNMVRDLKRFVQDHDHPDVVMARATIGPYMFPGPECWQAAPVVGGVTLSNWIVKRAVWEAVPYGAYYEGDAEFIVKCWQAGYRFAWWDRLICSAMGWSRGATEV